MCPLCTFYFNCFMGVIQIMHLKPVLVLFFILLLPFSAAASDGQGEKGVKIFDKNGSTVDGAIEKSENNSNNDKITSTGTTLKITDSGMDAGKEMMVNAFQDSAFWVGDSLLKGGFEIASIGVEDKKVTESQTPKYVLYSKNLDPFEPPIVKIFIGLCVIFHLSVIIMFIFLGSAVYSLQNLAPKEVSKIRAGFSGEESYFDIRSYLFVCGAVFISPFVDAFGIWYSTLNRNAVVSFMTSRMVEVLNVASDSLPTYLLVNLAWYANMLEKVLGEYTIYILTSLLIVKSWILGAILIFGSLKQAAVFHFSIMIPFLLVLFMDIITLFFVSFGVELSVWRSNWGYTLAGMIIAAVVDATILYTVYKGFKFLITYRFRNRIGVY